MTCTEIHRSLWSTRDILFLKRHINFIDNHVIIFLTLLSTMKNIKLNKDNVSQTDTEMTDIITLFQILFNLYF